MNSIVKIVWNSAALFGMFVWLVSSFEILNQDLLGGFFVILFSTAAIVIIYIVAYWIIGFTKR